MNPSDQENPIHIRGANAIPASAPPPARRRPHERVMQRQYLEDHPILIPVLTVLIGGLCLYLTLFSHLLRDWMLGPAPLRTDIKVFDDFMGYMIAFAIGTMFLSLVFLGVHGVDRAFHRLTRPQRICPRCRTAEEGKVHFPFTTVAGTGWDSVRCPNCGHEWYAKT
jgi:hypothetical protein